MLPPPPSGRSGSSTDSSLLHRVRAGDQDGWDRLVEWAGPLVYHWCRRAGLSPEDREDVFQDVFLKVARNIDRFDAHQRGASFRGWLLVITRHTLIDLARRRLEQPAARGGSEAYQRLLALTDEILDSRDSAASPAGPDSDPEPLRRALDLLRREFPERSWQAFWRTAVDGLSAPAAAAELGMSADAVRKAKSRILARLREEYDGLLT